MAGFLIHQSAKNGDPRKAVARADLWIRCEKHLSAAPAVVGQRLSVIKYKRRNSGSLNIAESAHGWLTSVGLWSHPRVTNTNDDSMLLDLLQEGGDKVLLELDGLYAIAWYDQRTGTLTIATDHIGRIHVFYALTSDGIFASTSCSALGIVAGNDPDPVAVYEMLATGTIFEDRTPLARVRRVPAASIYQFREGAIWRTTSNRRDIYSSVTRSPEQVIEVLAGATRALIAGARAPLCDLTGGLDSRLVLGLFVRGNLPITVTVSGQSLERDVVVATELARRLGLTIEVAGPELIHQRINFDDVLSAAALTEGSFDPIAYCTIARVHAMHAESYDLNLNGYGGELARNVWWKRQNIIDKNHDVVRNGAKRFVQGADYPTMILPTLVLDLQRHFEGMVERCLSGFNDVPTYRKLECLYIFLRMQCWLGSMTSATNQIWPAVSPLFQKSSLKAILAIDPMLRLGAKAMHRMYAMCSPVLASYPLATGFPPIDISLSNLPRFAPGITTPLSSTWRRLRLHIRLLDSADRSLVRNLFATGAAEYLDLPAMRLKCCIDSGEYYKFHERARICGGASPALVGRLIALESVYRAGGV